MGFFRVDENRCTKDGLCAAVCPLRLITFPGTDGFPALAEKREVFCLRCGHCVAVCPQGALSVDRIEVESCPQINDAEKITWDQAVQFLRSRRSIRVYRDEPVERATLVKLIETARYAPTASNSQLVHWTVIEGRESLRKLSEMTVEFMRTTLAADAASSRALVYKPLVLAWDAGFDGILRNAPALVVASAPREASNGLVDCTIALSYLELAAPLLRLGTCWAGLLQAAMLNSERVRSEIGLPENHASHYPMMIGYPKYTYRRLPERNDPVIAWK